MTELLHLAIVVNPDNTSTPTFVAQDGTTFTHADAAHALSLYVTALLKSPGSRIPTEAEHAAAVAKAAQLAEASKIPEGWEPTLDAVGVTVCGSIATYAKTFRRIADGAVHEVPVADTNGTTTPATAGVLRAYDDAHPVAVKPTE